ncbi:MAG: thiamine diphosphokinase [Candidatus Limnocylindrales bacterium]
MQVIVLADGDVGTLEALDAAWPRWLEAGARVVAADGGARHAARLGLRIDRWVGDGDSLGEAGIAELVSAGIPVERARTDKDESDTELAVGAALAFQPTKLAIVGALGGPRFDHALANVGLLALPGLREVDVRLIGIDARIRLIQAPGPDGSPSIAALSGRVGDGVSLLPVGEDVTGVTTAGLAYPLDDETLSVGRTRGLSNVRVDGERAAVEVRRGRLLVVETPATLTR